MQTNLFMFVTVLSGFLCDGRDVGSREDQSHVKGW